MSNLKINWQLSNNFLDGKFGDTNRINFKLFRKIKTKDIDLPVQKEILENKLLLKKFAGLNTRLFGLHFFKIKKKQAFFRKRYNTNLNTGVSGKISKTNSLQSVITLFLFWKKTLNYIRKRFRLHAGVKKKLCKTGGEVIITFINPFLVSLYYENAPNLSVISARNILLRFSIKLTNKALLKEIYSLL